MLVKLAFANVRKSARDFAVYFFTLVLGVAVFYAFNSIADSPAVQSLPTDVSEVVQLLTSLQAYRFLSRLCLAFWCSTPMRSSFDAVEPNSACI